LNELKAASDLAALEQTKGAWIGPHGRFTALMKQLGTLAKEEKPAAGKLINAAKVELEAALLPNAAANSNSKPRCPRNQPISARPVAAARLANSIRSRR
jgi:phenylalanyl-tRNA synthetase alpha subunit